MKNKWPTKKIKEICNIDYGTRVVRTRNTPGEFYVYGGGGKTFTSNKYNRENCVIISRFAMSINCVRKINGRFFLNDSGLSVSTKNKNILSQEFLDKLIFGLQDKIYSLGRGQAQRNLHIDGFKDLEIPLPPLEIQKKIIKILDDKFEKLKKAKKNREDSILNTEKILSKTLGEIFKKGKEKGWKEKSINELVIEIKSGFACGQQNKVNNGIIHLRTHNISLDGELNLDKIIRIPKSFVDEDIFNLKKDDIIFNNTNSKELVGKTILIHEDLPYAFSNHLTRIRFNKKIILPAWVLYVFQKYWSDKIFEKMCTRWIGQAGINQNSLGNLKIVVPPINEQQQIISKINKLSIELRRLKELQNSQLEDFNKLRKAYLKEAFSNELF
jgi:type I restriction enzyme S subunit